jgi:hypothetical protein
MWKLGAVAAQYLFWEYLIQIFGIGFFAVQAAGLLGPLSFSLAVTQCDNWFNRALSSLSTNMSDDHRKIPIFLFLLRLSNPNYQAPHFFRQVSGNVLNLIARIM